MSRPLIVIGDRTTHGGTVISADMTVDIDGKCVARVGDLTVCPKCKGIFPIKTGAHDLFDGAGNSYARHLDGTACGAKLISSQLTTVWLNTSSPGAGEADSDAAPPADVASIATPTSSGICLDCLLKAAAAGSALVVRE